MKKNQTGIILMLIGIALAIFCYYYVYMGLGEKRDTFVTQNKTLQEEVNYLQDLADHKQQYLDDTAAMEAENDEIIAKFPVEVRPEDEILYVDATEKNFDAKATNVSMPAPSVIEVTYNAPQLATVGAPAAETTDESETTEEGDGETTEAAPEAVAGPDIILYQAPVTVGFTSSYESVKKIIDAVVTDEEKMKSISTLALAFDQESGDLAGTITYNNYSLAGTGVDYVEPAVTGVSLGTGNIFNSASKKTALQAERAAEEAAASAAAAAED